MVSRSELQASSESADLDDLLCRMDDFLPREVFDRRRMSRDGITRNIVETNQLASLYRECS